MNNYEIINLNEWKRKVHFQVFRDYIEPSYCITFELDITEFLKKIKNRYSFTFSMIYVVSKCANEIEEFRYRFLNGVVVLFDKIDTAFTFLDNDTELFKVVNVKMTDTLDEYNALALNTVLSQKEYFTGPLGIDVFQFSPFPWFPILIFPIPFQEKRTIQRHFSIGESILKETAELFFRFQYRRIIRLLTVFT